MFLMSLRGRSPSCLAIRTSLAERRQSLLACAHSASRFSVTPPSPGRKASAPAALLELLAAAAGATLVAAHLPARLGEDPLVLGGRVLSDAAELLQRQPFGAEVERALDANGGAGS